METRDLLLLIGYLRSGNLFPVAEVQLGVPVQRTLHLMWDVIADRERTLFEEGETPPPPSSEDDIRRRSAFTAWSGDVLGWTSRIGEIPDPGVVLCLVYEGPATGAPLPVEVFSQTLRRFVLRDQAMRAKFEAHVNSAGTFVPPWLSPEVRRQRSWAAYDRAMRVAREEGFDAASPLLEGVRGDSFAPAQIALAMHELRELGDAESAVERLDEVLRVAPRHVEAHMLHAQILAEDPGRKVEAAADWLAVLRELGRSDTPDPAQDDAREAARAGLWALHRVFRNPHKLEVAAELSRHEPERGFAAVSHYVHTHPCAWDAQVLLASLALSRQSFELTIKLLADVRWLYARDPNPHFVYGQALASKGSTEAAVAALEQAARIAPNDADVARWLAFARGKLPGATSGPESVGVRMVHHVARTLLLLVGFVREEDGLTGGRIYPAVLMLHRVPGDVSLALVAQALAGQEERRFGVGPRSSAPPSSARRARADRESDLNAVSERVVLLDQTGARLSVDQLVGDVPDPGVLLAMLYQVVERDAEGHPKYSPAPDECRKTITDIARADTEIASKLERHLESPDATLMARLDRNQ